MNINQGMDQPPYQINKDSTPEQYDGLFKLLFRNKANKNMIVFENATKAQLLKLISNKTSALNKTSSGLYLCVNIDGVIYQINFAVM